MAQWVKVLPSEHKDLGSNSQNRHKSQAHSVRVCNLVLMWSREDEIGESLKACGPPSLFFF